MLQGTACEQACHATGCSDVREAGSAKRVRARDLERHSGASVGDLERHHEQHEGGIEGRADDGGVWKGGRRLRGQISPPHTPAVPPPASPRPGK